MNSLIVLFLLTVSTTLSTSSVLPLPLDGYLSPSTTTTTASVDYYSSSTTTTASTVVSADGSSGGGGGGYNNNNNSVTAGGSGGGGDPQQDGSSSSSGGAQTNNSSGNNSNIPPQYQSLFPPQMQQQQQQSSSSSPTDSTGPTATSSGYPTGMTADASLKAAKAGSGGGGGGGGVSSASSGFPSSSPPDGSPNTPLPPKDPGTALVYLEYIAYLLETYPKSSGSCDLSSLKHCTCIAPALFTPDGRGNCNLGVTKPDTQVWCYVSDQAGRPQDVCPDAKLSKSRPGYYWSRIACITD